MYMGAFCELCLQNTPISFQHLAKSQRALKVYQEEFLRNISYPVKSLFTIHRIHHGDSRNFHNIVHRVTGLQDMHRSAHP